MQRRHHVPCACFDLRPRLPQVTAVAANLRALEASIARYTAEYAALIGEAEGLKAQMGGVVARVDRAAALVASLSSERGRWEAGAEALSAALATLPADCLAGAAFLAYAGPFDHRARARLEAEWRETLDGLGTPPAAPASAAAADGTGADPSRARKSSSAAAAGGSATLSWLVPATDRVAWASAGLDPDDTLALGNAALLARHQRFPLIVDPSQAALGFLARLVASGAVGGGGTGGSGGPRALSRASFLDPGHLRAIEAAARFGTALLLTDAELLSPLLNPLLGREVVRGGGSGGDGDSETPGQRGEQSQQQQQQLVRRVPRTQH